MPIYEYECPECGAITEDICPMSGRKDIITCNECGGDAKRTMSFRGIVNPDAPNWLGSACELLVPDGERRPETRAEYNRYLSDNGIVERGGREV